MRVFKGKTAVITGAATGIGLACARAFARQGMSVALLDVRGEALSVAVENLQADGARAVGIIADVSKQDSMLQAAAQVEHHFGKIHLLMNNAAVLLRGLPVEDINDEAWNWILGVNLFGVIHGIQSFLPHIRAHGEGGHIVNMASISGLLVGARQNGAYATTKFAIVALSEALAHDLADSNIGVSTVLPAAVNTEFYKSSALHRGVIGGINTHTQTPDDTAAGMHPDEVAQRTLDGIRNQRFYIVTHVQTRAAVEQRHARILAAYDAAEGGVR
jgi:NAD(P)-dependent dehydrogenase (short-subunit alcohol dehydrogenase family)